MPMTPLEKLHDLQSKAVDLKKFLFSDNIPVSFAPTEDGQIAFKKDRVTAFVDRDQESGLVAMMQEEAKNQKYLNPKAADFGSIDTALTEAKKITDQHDLWKKETERRYDLQQFMFIPGQPVKAVSFSTDRDGQLTFTRADHDKPEFNPNVSMPKEIAKSALDIARVELNNRKAYEKDPTAQKNLATIEHSLNQADEAADITRPKEKPLLLLEEKETFGGMLGIMVSAAVKGIQPQHGLDIHPSQSGQLPPQSATQPASSPNQIKSNTR